MGFLPLLEPSRQERSSKQKLPMHRRASVWGKQRLAKLFFFKASGSLTAQESVAALSPKGSRSEKGSLL